MLRWVPTWLRWVFAALVVAVIVRYGVLPNVSDIESGIGQMRRIDPLLLVAGVVFAAASIASQAELTRTALPREHRPGTVDMLRIELAATALSHTVPGGTAAGTALGFTQLRQAGVPGPEAGLALGVRGIGSAAVLNIMLAVALLVSIPLRGANPQYVSAALLGGGVLITVVVVCVLLVRREDRTSNALARMGDRLPFMDGEAVGRGTHRVAERLRQVLNDRRLAARAAGWSVAHWLSNAASLFVFGAAFGVDVDPISMFVAFGIANVLAAVPVTPQGLGVVEGVLIPLLVAFGSGADAAALAVIAWRLVTFWAPIPAGAASYLSLRVAEAHTDSTSEGTEDDERPSRSPRDRDHAGR